MFCVFSYSQCTDQRQKSSRVALLEGKYDQQAEILAGLRQDFAHKEKALRDMESRTQGEFERKLREAGGEVAHMRAKLDAISSNAMPLREELARAHHDRQQLSQLVTQLTHRNQQLEAALQEEQGTFHFAEQMAELESLTEMQSQSLTKLNNELEHRDALLAKFEVCFWSLFPFVSSFFARIHIFFLSGRHPV